MSLRSKYRLLLHCCCGPCSIACVESLGAEGLSPALFWYNPNIHPFAEYQNRRDALLAFAAAKNLPLEKIDEYGLRLFLQSAGTETEAPQRCETCYRLRLEKTASYAAEHGYDAFSATLLISPYQRHDAIRRLGEEFAAQYGIEFLYRDFRPLFREGQAKARALGLYMQKYCGCIFSEERNRGWGIREQGTGIRDQRPVTSYRLPVTGNWKLETGNSPLLTPHSSLPTPRSPIPDPRSLFHRLALLTGTEALDRLGQTSVLVFGLGGVGSWCAEALVRSGVGRIGIVDYDTVCESNVNRQAQATSRTLGRVKAEALQERLLEINPRCEVTARGEMFSRENAARFGIESADYVIDAIDSLPHKLDLIETSCAAGVKFFASMGMAKKLDPARVKIGSIWETHGCPLARLVRQGLRKRGFNGDFTVVFSDEPPSGQSERPDGTKTINGSAVTVTASAGMALASLVLRDVMGIL